MNLLRRALIFSSEKYVDLAQCARWQSQNCRSLLRDPYLELIGRKKNIAQPGILPHRLIHFTSIEDIDLRASHCIVFDDFKHGVENDEIRVIDVREPEEVQSGHVPARRFANIPIDELDEALSDLTDEEFIEKYGMEKPDKYSDDIVFNCGVGSRSSQAVKIARDAGYLKAKHFPGGLAEWIKKVHS